jgi:hypothetical protein
MPLTPFDKMRANRHRRSAAAGDTRKHLMIALIDELEREEMSTWGRPSGIESQRTPVDHRPPRRLFSWLRR